MKFGMTLRAILKIVASFIIIGFTSLNAYCDKITVTGLVKDKATSSDLYGAKARILNVTDSTLVAEAKAEKRWKSGSTGNWTQYSEPRFQLRDIDRGKKYILQIVRENYDTLYYNVDPAKASRRSDTMDIGKFFMRRKAKTLGEVTVQATKVKFYNRGDTLVYNADAFNLAEGSMLDALIKQLPGAELMDDGRIYVNGRFVEDLLLNGKDFFKGNNKLMLENLGAYTVKEIKVYDRQDDMDRLMGKDYGKKTYSMDVRLKKEYSQGILLNAEAGYGTKNRYLGRLFALWYSDHARIGAYGNANNLSNNSKPGQNNSFNSANMNSGEFNKISGGIDYTADMPGNGVVFSGNVKYDYTKIHTDKHIYRTNFLSSGDTYNYRFYNGNQRNWSVSTSHSVKFDKDLWNMQINPSFSYIRQNNGNDDSNATFSKDFQDISKEFIDKIYSSAAADVLASLLNRSISLTRLKGETTKGALKLNGKRKTSQTDALSWTVSGDYTGRKFNRNEDFALNFGSDPIPADGESRHFKDYPDHKYKVDGGIGYIYGVFPGFFIDMKYKYLRESSLATSDLFRAENIYSSFAESGNSILPSLADFERKFDPDNSYESHYSHDLHGIFLDLDWDIKSLNMSWNIEVPVNYRNQRLHYLRGDINQVIKRNKFFLGDLSINMNWSSKVGWIYLGIDRTVKSPDLVNMVDMTDALNPLNIIKGSSGLKDSEHLNARIYLSCSNQKKGLSHNYGLTYNVTGNALAMGYNYNSSTGVRESRMYNINGNWNILANQSVNYEFGHLRRFNIGNRTNLFYNRSVDMLGENGSGISKNTVNKYSIGESINFGYSTKAVRVSLTANGDWNRFTSGMAGFAAFNAWNFKYGINGNFKLPARFEISTDFTIYSRRGYSDKALNTDNYVWNARLSYTAFRNRWIFMVDGFDLLHNLKNISQTVNAQGRTETWSNVLPRYILFHIQWKFHKLPKKK